MNLDDALSGKAGLAGVRWVLLDPAARRVLRRELAALLGNGHTLGPCRLRRAKFKPGHKLTAYYEVQLRAAHGAVLGTRPVAVTWIPSRPRDRASAATAVADLQDEAVRRGLAAPFRSLAAELPAWGMRILVSPLDERFPQLGRLCDPSYLATALPGSGDSRYAVTTIRYRPGQRHVLRYDRCASVEAATGPEAIFAKLYLDDRGSRTFRLAVRVSEWLEARGDGLAAARPLAYLDDERVLLYPRVAGVPLSEQIRRRRRNPQALLSRAGGMLQALHLAPTSRSDALQRRELSTEIGAIARAGEHVDTLLPSTGARIRELLSRAQELHDRLPREGPTFVHGDFKADHLLVGPGTITLIDFDRCCLADPALDVGKFLADLVWWYTTTDVAELERAQQSFLDGYFQGVPSERLARARIYEALLLTKIAVRRVRPFDPHWQSRTEALIARAEALLTNAGSAQLYAPAASMSERTSGHSSKLRLR